MIDPERVDAIFRDCLFHDDEDTSEAVIAEGIVSNYGFQPQRLEDHRPAIEAMLDQLPDQFKLTGGGGWSFLNACEDRDGVQWTGMHLRMEQLFCLGIALGLAHYLAPRDLWSVLPGGMPYISVTS